jgi:hypothetical protein
MASESSGGAGMGMVVGALLVLVLIIGAFMLFGGGSMLGGGGHKSVDVNINAPSLPNPTVPSPK